MVYAYQAAETRSQTSLQSWQAFSQSLQTECFSCFLHSASQSPQMPLTTLARSFTCGESAAASSRSARAGRDRVSDGLRAGGELFVSLAKQRQAVRQAGISSRDAVRG